MSKWVVNASEGIITARVGGGKEPARYASRALLFSFPPFFSFFPSCPFYLCSPVGQNVYGLALNHSAGDAWHFGVMQCVTVCCSVLHCVAVRPLLGLSANKAYMLKASARRPAVEQYRSKETNVLWKETYTYVHTQLKTSTRDPAIDEYRSKETYVRMKRYYIYVHMCIHMWKETCQTM